MKSDRIQKYQMLERVFNFGQAHLNDFPKGSSAASLITGIGSAVAKLKSHASQQVSGAGAIQQSGISHQDARKALKTKLDLIFQTARVLNLEQFYLPRQRTDAAYIAAGQSFAELAQPFEEQFVKQGLPLNFIALLGAAVADLQRTAMAQTSSKGAHSGSIADFNETLKQAMADLKRFDALVKNTIANDPGILADAFTGCWGRDATARNYIVDIDQAARTAGAFVLRLPAPGGVGHVVVSDGRGGTVEAHSSKRGVIRDTLQARRWDYGIVPPMLHFTAGAPLAPVVPPQKTILRLTLPSSSRPLVLSLQRALRKHGIHPSPLDGVYGPMTLAEVKAFQLMKGLVVGGEAGPAVAKALGIAWR